MILDKRIKWVEKFKRNINHFNNGIKKASLCDTKINFFVHDGEKDRFKRFYSKEEKNRLSLLAKEKNDNIFNNQEHIRACDAHIYLGISSTTFYNLRHKHHIPSHYMYGNCVKKYYHKRDLDIYKNYL